MGFDGTVFAGGPVETSVTQTRVQTPGLGFVIVICKSGLQLDCERTVARRRTRALVDTPPQHASAYICIKLYHIDIYRYTHTKLNENEEMERWRINANIYIGIMERTHTTHTQNIESTRV